jgi:hypothetical protein
MATKAKASTTLPEITPLHPKTPKPQNPKTPKHLFTNLNMKFNLKDELRNPRNSDSNRLEEPRTNDLQRSPSYYEAKRLEQKARENLRSVNGIRPTAVFSGTGLFRPPD